MTTLLIVDDEPLVRLAVRALEDWESRGFRIAAEASNGLEALAVLESGARIDIALVDVDMPAMNGLDFAEALRERESPPCVLFLSSFDTFEYARRAFKAGAADYILKNEMDEGRLLGALVKISARRAPADTQERSEEDRKSEFLAACLEGPAPAQMPEFRLRPPMTALLIKPADPRLLAERYGEKPESFRRIVLDLLRQCLLRRDSGEAHGISVHRYLVLMNSDGDAQGFLEDFSRAARNYLDMTFEARSAGPVASWTELREHYLRMEGQFSAGSRIVVRARRYIREHYADPRLDLAAVAAYAEVSKNHLSWEFSRETGESLSSCIAKVRIEEAKKLLERTGDRTYEIAEKVGFQNVETFCRVFKKITGTTPRGYSS